MNEKYEKKSRQNRGEPSPCPVCGVIIANSYGLSCHIKRHNNYKPFKCDKCPLSFIIRGELKRHLIVHSTARPFICGICSKSYRNKLELQIHEDRLHKLGAYKCNQCDRTFQKNGYLISHIKTVHTKTKLKCSFCWKTFSSNLFKDNHEKTAHSKLYISRLSEPTGNSEKDGLQSPLRTSGNVRTSGNDHKRFKCTICEQRFKYKAELFDHCKTFHTEEFSNIYTQCDRCLKFLTNKVYPNHMKAHKGDFTHECTFCDFKTMTKYGLALHLKVHSKEFPEACSICNKPFKSKAHAYNCEQRHKGVRNVKCDDCDKRFHTKLVLKVHRSNFHRTHKCSICYFEAGNINILRLHRKQNHKQQIADDKTKVSIMCDICGMFFKSRTSLTRHSKNHQQESVNLSVTNSQENLPVCRYCSYQGKSQQEILIHCLQLHPSKVYKCEICSFATMKLRKIELHEKTHGETMEQQESYFYTKFKQKYISECNYLECFICGYSSNLKDHMEIHLRKHELFLEKFDWFAGINFEDVSQNKHSPEHDGTQDEEFKYRYTKTSVQKHSKNVNFDSGTSTHYPNTTAIKTENRGSSGNTEVTIKQEGIRHEISVSSDKDTESSKKEKTNINAAFETSSLYIDTTGTNNVREIINQQLPDAHQSIRHPDVYKVKDDSTFSEKISDTKADATFSGQKSDSKAGSSSKSAYSDLASLSSKVKSFDGKLFMPIEDLISIDNYLLAKEKVQKLLKHIGQHRTKELQKISPL